MVFYKNIMLPVPFDRCSRSNGLRRTLYDSHLIISDVPMLVQERFVMVNRIDILDTTLRDGAQGEGISFSVDDKLNIMRALDQAGMRYIEGGNPAASDRELQFFREAKENVLHHAELVAFGSTARKNTPPEEDANLAALLAAGTKTVSIFGKSSDMHVTEVLGTTLQENLRMIGESVRYLRANGREVIYDAEHFFDGYKANAEYALETIEQAVKNGASVIALCDTNGGTFPEEIFEIVRQVAPRFRVHFGIHCHNDLGLAVACSMSAVNAGVTHIQGTFIGYGERCGNANLSTVIPNLQLKRHMMCIPPECLKLLTPAARTIAEVSNVSIRGNMPYVGLSAFAHKAGMHADGVIKNPLSFEHVNPSDVGNERRFLTSEMSGRMSVLKKIGKIAPYLTKDSPELFKIVEVLKEKESRGYQYEGAEASFELVVRRVLGMHSAFFKLESFRTIGEENSEKFGYSASAIIKISVDGKSEITAAEGDGPVHALDRALRKALEVFYPVVKTLRLIDYKVRVLDPDTGTAALTRVLMTTTDGKAVWSTVGVSRDILEASWNALADSVEICLLQEADRKHARTVATAAEI